MALMFHFSFITVIFNTCIIVHQDDITLCQIMSLLVRHFDLSQPSYSTIHKIQEFL